MSAAYECFYCHLPIRRGDRCSCGHGWFVVETEGKGMDDLMTWLRAQLDEDERVAKAAIQGPWRTGAMAGHLVDDVIYGRSPYAYDGPGGDKIVQVANLEIAWEKKANAEHIARHDPARVLREVDAKRRIVNEYDSAKETSRKALANYHAWLNNEPDPHPDVQHSDSVDKVILGLERAVHLLALPYADRPGYREQWRP